MSDYTEMTSEQAQSYFEGLEADAFTAMLSGDMEQAERLREQVSTEYEAWVIAAQTRMFNERMEHAREEGLLTGILVPTPHAPTGVSETDLYLIRESVEQTTKFAKEEREAVGGKHAGPEEAQGELILHLIDLVLRQDKTLRESGLRAAEHATLD